MAGQQGIRAGKAYVELNANDSKLVKGLRSAQRKLRRFGQMITGMGARLLTAATAITGPILAAAKSFANFGDAVNKMSARTGLSAKAVSALGFAAEQSGTDIKTLEAGFRGMSRFILNAERGLSTATDSMDDLGLSIADLSSGNPEETFKLIADRIATIEDPSKRAALAMSIFGRSGSMLLPLLEGGAAGVEALQKEAEQLGITMSDTDAKAAADLTDALNRMKRALYAAWINGGAALAEGITEMANYIAKASKVVSNFVKENKDLVMTITKVGAVVGIIGGTLIAVGSALGIASFAIGGLISAGGAIATVLGFLSTPVLAVVAAVTAAVIAVAAFTSWLIKSGDVVKQFGRLVMAVFNAFVTFVSTGPLAVAAKLLWASLKVVWVEGIGDLNKTWDKLKEAWSEVADSFVADWKSAIGEVKKEMKGLNDEVNKPKKAGGNGGGGAAGGGSGIRFDFGLWGEWYDNFMNPPGIPANEGVIETFAMRPEDVRQGGKKTNPADNVPIMPEFAPEPPGEDPETKAAREKLSELQQELAKLSIDDSSAKSIRGDIGSGSQLGKLVNTINAAGAGRTMEQLARDGNSLQAEAVRILDIMKRRMENGGDFAEAG